MDQVLGIRPFVPAKDFALSRRFYAALGFAETHTDASVVILKLGGFSFILQDVYVAEFADNCMVQLLVRDVGAWWAGLDPAKLVAEFAIREPRAPAMQDWGLKVGFLFDPAGVLWHVAEVPF